MDTLTQMFFSDIKAYDTPKEYEVILTRAGIPKQHETQRKAPAVEIRGTINVAFGKRTWIPSAAYQSLVFNGFRFVVVRER